MESQLLGMHVKTVDSGRQGIVRHVAYAIVGYEGCIDERMSIVIELADGRFIRCATNQIRRDVEFYEGDDD